MIPELTNMPPVPPALDETPVLVSPQVLRFAATSTAAGAAAMWLAYHAPARSVAAAVPQFAVNSLLTVLLYVLVAATLPVQLLVTRVLVRDVWERSVAPRRMKLIAALAVSSGTVLAAAAYWQAFSEMCSLGS